VSISGVHRMRLRFMGMYGVSVEDGCCEDRSISRFLSEALYISARVEFYHVIKPNFFLKNNIKVFSFREGSANLQDSRYLCIMHNVFVFQI